MRVYERLTSGVNKNPFILFKNKLLNERLSLLDKNDGHEFAISACLDLARRIAFDLAWSVRAPVLFA
jgi:hypothetical protein